MDQYTQAKELKKMIRLVVEEVVGDLTRSCFRCYKATVVKPPYQDPVFGNVCKIKLVGDSQVIAVAYTSQMQYMQTGDVVWVATFYNSFRNAIVWQNVFFNNGELNFLDNKVYDQGQTIIQQGQTISQQGQTISQQGTAIGNLQTGLNDKASQSSVDNLQEQVNNQGQTISQQGTAIGNLQTGLNDKASQSSVDNLQQQVNGQGQTISQQGTAIGNLQTGLNDKASQSSVNSLQQQVNGQGQTISQQGTAIGNLQTGLNDKASQSSVNSLQQQVNSQGQIITEQTSDIDWLNYLIEETQTELQKLKDIVESGGDTPSGDTQDDSTSTTTGDVGEDQRTTTRIDMTYLATNGSAGAGDVTVGAGEDSSFNNGAQFPLTITSANEDIIKITIGTTFGAELSASVGLLNKSGSNRWIWSSDSDGIRAVIITSETAGAAATGIEILTKP